MNARRFYRALATVLPAMLGPGIIHLHLQGRISELTAFFLVCAMASMLLLAMSRARKASYEALVRHNQPLFTKPADERAR